MKEAVEHSKITFENMLIQWRKHPTHFFVPGVDKARIWWDESRKAVAHKYGLEFVEHALKIIPDGNKVAMFLKIQFLEGKKRKKLFIENPPKTLYVSSGRLLCAKNADFEGARKGGGSAVAYGWLLWQKGFNGSTKVEWFN